MSAACRASLQALNDRPYAPAFDLESLILATDDSNAKQMLTKLRGEGITPINLMSPHTHDADITTIIQSVSGLKAGSKLALLVCLFVRKCACEEGEKKRASEPETERERERGGGG